MTVELVLRFIARLLPPLAKQRYLEEWQGDARAADGAGVRPFGIVTGAIALALTIDRDSPAHTGEPRGALPRRLARRGLALLTAAAAILIGAWGTGGGIVPEGRGVTADVVAALGTVAWVTVRVAVLAAIVGGLYLLRAAATAETGLARSVLVIAVVGPGALAVAVALPGSAPLIGVTGLLLTVVGLIGGMGVVAGTPPRPLAPRTAPRAYRVPVAWSGALLVLLVVVVGAIDLLVWNPVAKVPGLSLREIYDRMTLLDRFSLPVATAMVAVWAAFWAAPAILLAVLAAHRRASALTPRRLAILMLGLVGGAIFFRFFAGFSVGMSIADTFYTSGADTSIVSASLPYVGQLALAGAAVAFGWAPRPPRAASLPVG